MWSDTHYDDNIKHMERSGWGGTKCRKTIYIQNIGGGYLWSVFLVKAKPLEAWAYSPPHPRFADIGSSFQGTWVIPLEHRILIFHYMEFFFLHSYVVLQLAERNYCFRKHVVAFVVLFVRHHTWTTHKWAYNGCNQDVSWVICIRKGCQISLMSSWDAHVIHTKSPH